MMILTDDHNRTIRDRLRCALSLHEEDRCAYLICVMEEFGDQCSAHSARHMGTTVRRLANDTPAVINKLLHGIARMEGIGVTWFRACLLEASGRNLEAAETFLGVNIAADREACVFRLIRAAQSFVAAGAWDRAAQAIRQVGESPCSYWLISEAATLLRTIRQHGSAASRRQCRLAILGTTSFDFWAPALDVFAFSVGIDLIMYAGSINQYRQEILNPASALAEFRPEVVLLAIDWRSLGFKEEVLNPGQAIAEVTDELRNLWAVCRQRFGAFVIQHNFEVPAESAYGALTSLLPGGRSRVIRTLNQELLRSADAESGVAIFDIDQVASIHGKGAWNDFVRWHAARQHPALDAIPELTAKQTAYLKSLLGLSAKCVVTDLDGTLWGGVIGEDGPGGIKLGRSWNGEPFLELQSYLKALHDRGIILAVCSKNNEADAKLPFESHPDMVLRLEDIAVFKANWEPKAANIRSIADSLGIGLDSIVFLDDNPLERALVRAELPEVKVIELGADAANYVRTLDRAVMFETLTLTGEDRNRAGSYGARASLGSSTRSGMSVNDVIRDLKMKVDLRPLGPTDIARAAQLTNKTNQFNLNGKRLTEGHVQRVMADELVYTQCMRVEDRHADHGFTGLMLAKPNGTALEIDIWVMSCRVLGRRLEEAMMSALLSYAARTGFTRVHCEYAKTNRNQALAGVLERLGFEPVDPLQGEAGLYDREVANALDQQDIFTIADMTSRRVAAAGI